MHYQLTVPQFQKMLRNLSAFLDKGAEYAKTKKFDYDAFMQTRLAPDQFPLVRQIQIACDTAKLCVSRLTGKDAPSHPDDEKTFADLKKRIQSTIDYLGTFRETDFAHAANAKVTQPRWEGKSLYGTEYLIEHAIPNFYFHITTAYSILRSNGVDVGKKDYLGPMPFHT